jgi:hypothetical protein
MSVTNGNSSRDRVRCSRSSIAVPKPLGPDPSCLVPNPQSLFLLLRPQGFQRVHTRRPARRRGRSA